ncbi:hypothetical protein [Nocardioides zeae]|uniref:DUF559 domain-containing protein n=1 Tax=Nocardioides zeae TaxID=1457234 RepID=A0A6P0HIT7_9ACTN|nr:hypothetical protein [Nocardioides zeae]NEN78147.1 hypothetical protein [Nocardioides zeae]
MTSADGSGAPDHVDLVELGRVRRAGWSRVVHGAHRQTAQPPDGPDLDLLAVQQVLPPSAVLTGLTAARARGWWLPLLPDDVPVFAGVPRGSGRVRRPEVRLTRTAGPAPSETMSGLRLASPPRTLLDCGRLLGTLDLAIVVAGALHCGVTRASVEEAAHTPGARGGPRLRAALDLVLDGAESAMETVLGGLCLVLGLDVRAQHEVRDLDGRLVARGDLWLVGTRTLVEYDGATHREPAAQRDDLRRDRRLGAVDWGRIAVTRPDLLGQVGTLARDLDRAAGREHDPARLRPWRALLRESTQTPAGMTWLCRRWAPRRLPPRAA